MLKLNRHYFYSISLFTGAVLLILFSDYTFSATAFLILLRQSAILGLMSIGMGMVMLTGSIDLSAGAVLSLGSSVCCVILAHNPDAVLLSVAAALAACTLCGFLNGILITSLSLPAAILTFTMALVYTGLSFLSKARMAKWLAPSAFCSAFNGNIGIVPTGAMLWFILLALASLIMRFTYWGQYIYAIGENEQALLMLGVQTKWYKICTHTICGFFSGLAGIFMLARISAPSISTNFPLVLEGLTALSFGGIHFSGSTGRLSGLLLGTLTLIFLKVCMIIYAFPSDVQNLILALLFLISLVIARQKQ